MKPNLTPVFLSTSSLYFDLKLIRADMSTSLKVVREAAVFCDCLRRSAIRRRMRFILTRRSSRLPSTGLAGFSAGADDAFFGVSFLGGAGFEGSAGLDSDLGSGLDSGSAGLASVEAGSSFGASLDSALSPPSGGAPPASILAMSWPTVTVSSSLARSSVMVPASGALTATSIW